MKNHRSFRLLVCLLTVFVLFSCKQDPEIPQNTVFTTPTITGIVSIPSASGFKPEDVWVKVKETGTVIKAGADGKFVIENLDENDVYTLEFSTVAPSNITSRSTVATNYATNISNVKAEAGIGSNIGYVILRPTGTVKGKVLLAGVESSEGIIITATGTTLSVQTDSDGTYVLPNLPEGAYTIVFSKDGYIQKTVEGLTIMAPSDTESPIIELNTTYLLSADNTSCIEGSVKFADKDDPAGITLTLSDSQGNVIFQLDTTSSGLFSFKGITAGTYSLSASALGYDTVSREVTVSERQVYSLSFNPLSKSTPSTAVIGGTVCYADKADSTGIMVTLASSSGVAINSVYTSESGKYLFINVTPGSYTITSSATGYRNSQKVITVVAGSEYEVNPDAMISTFGNVTGTIAVNDSESPENAQISIAGEGGRYSTIVGEDGVFGYAGLAVGTYSYTIEKTGYTSITGDFSVEAGKTTTIPEKKLESLYGNLECKVSYEDKENSSGIIVSIYREDSLIKSIISDATGKITVEKLLIGDVYSIKAEYAKYASSEKKPVSIESGKTTSVVLDELKLKYASVVGAASLFNSTSNSGISVILNNQEGTPVDSTTTDSEGQFGFDDIEPGTYQIIARKTGYSPSTTEVTVIAGGSYSVKLDDLSSLYGIISGSVTLEEENDCAGITVTATGAHTYTATTSSDGSFKMTDVIPGHYTFSYQKNGFIAKTDDTGVTVEAGAIVSSGTVRLDSKYCSVSGTVSFSDKNDASGIAVSIKDSQGNTIATSETESSGLFAFDRLDAGNYSIEVSADGYITRVKDILITAGRSYTVSIDSLYNISGSITGTVMLSGQSDYSNVSIKVFNNNKSYSAISNSTGSFVFPQVEPGTYSVSYSINGFETKTISNVVVEESSERTIEAITLSSSFGSIRVTAKYSDAADASGITVSLYDNEEFVSNLVTGADGIVLFNNVSIGSDYKIVAENENYYSKQRTAVIVNSGTETNVVMDSLLYRFGTVYGKATNNSNTAIDGATIVLVSDNDSAVSFTITTGSDGLFQNDRIDTGSYSVTIMAQNHSNKTLTEKITVGSRQAVNIGTVSLVPIYGTVSGSVGYADRDNPKDIAVVLKNNEGSSVASVITTDSGSYSIVDIVPGEYTIHATADGYSAVSKSVTVSAGQNYSVDLGNLKNLKGSIKGKVMMSGSADHAGITVVAESANHTYYASTNSIGEYTIVEVEPGTYSLGYSKAGYVSDNDSVIVSAGEQTNGANVTLLENLGAISGKALIEGKIDNSGITVSVRTVSDPDRLYTVTTVEDGSFFIGSLKAGEYVVSVAKEGFSTDSVASATVTYGTTTKLDSIAMKSIAANVSGIITLDGAADHSGIQVLLQNEDGSLSYNTTTGQNGKFVLSQVMPGEYKVYFSKSGYETYSITNVNVTQSTDLSLEDIQLQVSIRSVTGSLTLELRDDYSGALVTATNLADQTKVYSAISNSNGNYTLAGMVPGEYSVVMTHAGYRTVTLPTVDVIEGSTKTLDSVCLEINRGTISGVSTKEGRTSSEGIKVELLQGNSVVETKYTDEGGGYSFYVPQGNYSGIRMSSDDFRTETISSSIALFADNYISLDNIMLRAIANTVYGSADVLTTDDESNVTVSFYGHEEIASIITGADGSFRFEHIPLGSYSIRFRRENCSDIIIPVTVSASDGISLGTVTLSPNTATIKGKVNLQNGSSLSGVLVSVVMGDKTVTGRTDSSGRYEIGGVSIADTYTVTYSKDGWDSKTQLISPKLEKLEMREMEEITLVDTTAPVLNSVVINSGANTAADRNVSLHFTTTEQGSGVSKVMITYDNVFDRTVTRHDYLANMDWELPSGNGEKIVYVRVVDNAGNESNTVSAKVTLTDQKKEVSGVLIGNNLHWTEDMSPYLVIGNIMVESDKTLVIDPGVDVQFAGAYYIQVEGQIEAIGTEQKKISFYGIDEGKDTWQGINCVADNLVIGGSKGTQYYIDGSILKHVRILNCNNGISGNIYIESGILDSDDNVLGSSSNAFYGMIKNSLIRGNIISKTAFFYENNIKSENCNFIWGFGYFYGNTIVDSFGVGICGYDNVLRNCQISCSQDIVNNAFYGCRVSIQGEIINNSFEDCILSVMRKHFSGSYTTVSNCSFINCSFEKYQSIVLNYSNLINCDNLLIDSSRSEIFEFDMRYNFWGYDKTKELDETGDNCNLSFISDYYDDFNKTKAVYSEWVPEPFNSAGYQDESYVSFDARQLGITLSGENWIQFSSLSNGISEVCVVTDVELLAGDSADMYWDDMTDSVAQCYKFDFDASLHTNVDSWFVQIKDLEGNTSGISKIDFTALAIGPTGGYIFYDCDADNTEEDPDGPDNLMSSVCGWRYLEAAPADLRVVDGVPTIDSLLSGYSNSSRYYVFGYNRTVDDGRNLNINGTFYDDGCSEQALGTGKNNTRLLVDAMGDSAYSLDSGSDKTCNYAAILCENLTYTVGGVVYNDWFLPSIDELSLMYSQLGVNDTCCFEKEGYWSSSERILWERASHAYSFDFSYGRVAQTGRDQSLRVRPVRAF